MKHQKFIFSKSKCVLDNKEVVYKYVITFSEDAKHLDFPGFSKIEFRAMFVCI